MKFIILAFVLVAGITAVPVNHQTKARYDNYQVYRFVPKDAEEVELFSSLETSFPGIKYWKRPGQPGTPVDIMVPPHLQYALVSGLETLKVDVSAPWIENVQELIDEEERQSQLGREKSPSPYLGWEAYYDYADILDFLDEQARLHPNISSVETYGTSFENRPLRLIKISTGGNGQRPVIFLDANIHAREWITNAVATYVINELLNGQEDGIKSLLNTFDFHIAPCLNPDGYTFTRQRDRMWRGTRSNYAGGACRGADPNRNFGFYWNTGGSSRDCNSEIFMGVSAFSENETRAISDYYTTIASRTSAYLSLHSYSQLVLIPYGTQVDGNNHIPDHDNHMRVGRLVESAIARRFGTPFRTGNIVDLLYVASGGSSDWAKGEHNTTLAYTFELRDTGRYGFILPPDQIIDSSLELIDGLIALVNDLKTQLKL